MYVHVYMYSNAQYSRVLIIMLCANLHAYYNVETEKIVHQALVIHMHVYYYVMLYTYMCVDIHTG